MCVPPYVSFLPHFHESGNEHLSLLLPFLNVHGHATFLLPAFLSQSVSSSVFHFKNVGCLDLYDQLQWHSHFQRLLMALRTPWQTMTTCVSPTWSHWLGDRLPVCGQLVPHEVRIPFVLFLWDVQLFPADFGRLSARAVCRITFSQEAGSESSLGWFLDGCTRGSQCAGAQTQPCL